MIKTAVWLGLMASLVGCIKASPVVVKADASVKASVRVESSVAVTVGKANAEPKAKTGTTKKSKKAATTTTKARTMKGKGKMNNGSINAKKSGGKVGIVANAGEDAPNGS